MPAAKWSIDKPASRRAQPAVVGRGLSEGLGGTFFAWRDDRLTQAAELAAGEGAGASLGT